MSPTSIPPLPAGLFSTDTGRASARGPALVLVHGAGECHRHWPPSLLTVPGRRVLAVDLPGHGGSPGPALPTVEAMAARLLEFLQAQGLGPAVLAGHSLGGAVALTAALLAPARVAGLVLIATGARLRVAPEVLEATRDPSALARAAETLAGFSVGSEAPAGLREAYQADLAAAGPALHSDLLACDAFDVMERLPELRAPALVVCGTQDQLTPPKYGTFLRDCLPGSRLELVGGAGHLVMLEAPEQVSEAVEDFLQRLESAPPVLS